MVSTDRLIAIAAPVRYYWHYYSYQTRQIIFYFGSVCLSSIVGYILSFDDTETIMSNLCWTGEVLKPVHAEIVMLIMIFAPLLGVILYGIVFLLTRKQISRIKSVQRDETSLRVFTQRQRKLTVTMGISCAFTLFFYVLPVCLKYINVTHDYTPATFSYPDYVRIAVAISCNLNPLTNIAAILIRHEDIACCVMKMFPGSIQKCFARYAHMPSVAHTSTCLDQYDAEHGKSAWAGPGPNYGRFVALGRQTRTVYIATRRN
ncbi:unnamed protein product [Gongylonema pulchrum]|uniref:G_PROTEIN_RECEP_F1_2 domain-containing protein n=1 Tax=Gongylonema pulchrum TaxID=637853 RepID=A0A183D7R3_9BILA|nr:unnamed protein product [Gongylonema pulchrum]